MVENLEDKNTSVYPISGMHCAMCVKTVENAIKGVTGVVDVKVNLGTESAYVNSNKALETRSIASAVKSAGYEINGKQIDLDVDGMHCAMCVRSVEKSLVGVKGILGAVADLSSETVRVSYISGEVTLSEMKMAVSKAGYTVTGISGESVAADEIRKTKKLQIGLYFSLSGIITGICLMLLMYVDIMVPVYIQLVIILPFLIILGGPIFKAAYLSLRNASLTMDVMYSMGIGVALISSILALLGVLPGSGFVFFDTVLMLASFLTLGRFLEAKARRGTGEAIKKLMELKPSSVIVDRDGEHVDVPVDDLVPGDIVLCRHGETIPADGDIVEGKAYIDESMITGESIPVKKEVGDSVIGGTLNKNGFIRIRVLKIGSETVLSGIIRVVREAQMSKPAIEKLADKAVSYFIPVVFAVAVITLLAWRFAAGSPWDVALTRFISVLVVACPCALGLATPTAVTAGVGRGAQLGILIRNGDALENSSGIDTAVFDKTGTLTAGFPSVTSVKTIRGDEGSLKLKVASLERYASHPIASAISSDLLAPGLKPLDAQDVKVIEGKGIRGIVDGSEFFAGSSEFYLESGGTEDMNPHITSINATGETLVVVWDNSGLMFLGISDPLKRDAVDAMEALKRMNIELYMLTGDSSAAADPIARKLGIKNVISSVKPAEKSEKLKELKITGRVLFAGDGINDAPALVAADLGIAMGNGTDAAIESGGIVTMKSDLILIPAALQLASRVFRQIKLNLFWAFIYNIVLIPIAAGALYSIVDFRPELAGAAMALSSVTVVSLSLLLKRYTPEILRRRRN